MIEILKKTNEKHISQLLKLEKEIFKDSAISEKSLHSILGDKNYTVYVYIIDDNVCSYLVSLDSIDVYEVISIATAIEYRNKQCAQKLLDKIKNKDIFLEVRESNLLAINFYKKNNFKQISIRKKYYSEPTEDAIIMKLEVNNE